MSGKLGKILIGGVKYNIDKKTNILYDMNTKKSIGKYDKKVVGKIRYTSTPLATIKENWKDRSIEELNKSIKELKEDLAKTTDLEEKQGIDKLIKLLMKKIEVLVKSGEPLEEEEEEEEEEEDDDEFQLLDDDNFAENSDWDLIRPLKLSIGESKTIYYYNKKIKDYSPISSIDDGDITDGKIDDLADMIYPIKYDIKHTKTDLFPIYANFFVGYTSGQKDTKTKTFYFAVFWNGTITIDGEIEKINTDIDITQPIGYFVIDTDNSLEKLADRMNAVQGYYEENEYTINYIKNKDVSKEINNNFEPLQEDQRRKAKKEGSGIRRTPSVIRRTPTIDNPVLYEKAKADADNIFKKPSAFKSGWIVKKYKEMGGTYSGDKPEKTGISRWFKEEWKDVGNQEYPVFRPTKRITKKTPLTPQEIDPSNLKKQIALKQVLKGDANLPKFEANILPKVALLNKWSNPTKVAEKAKKYLGNDVMVYLSTKPKKKYMIINPDTNKEVHFGEMGYEDNTKSQDPIRRENYLKRSANIKGNWKNNKYSPNNLSRNLLW
jgi:hypothetical protein